MRSFGRVKTTAGRWTLALMIAMSLAFAVWSWLRPYDGNADPAARAKVLGVELRRDHSFYWLEVHVRAKKGNSLDFSRPVRMTVGELGREVMPADTRLSGSPEKGFSEAWIKFWLEESDMAGHLDLVLGEERLRIKSRPQGPALASGQARHFTTNQW